MVHIQNLEPMTVIQKVLSFYQREEHSKYFFVWQLNYVRQESKNSLRILKFYKKDLSAATRKHFSFGTSFMSETYNFREWDLWLSWVTLTTFGSDTYNFWECSLQLLWMRLTTFVSETYNFVSAANKFCEGGLQLLWVTLTTFMSAA